MHNESGHVLFVHAHPDDETITTGGTIATLIDSGAGVTVVTCTRGERGEVIPPEFAHLEGDGPRLAEHREGELAEAIRILGARDHRFLGAADARHGGLAPRRYLDSGMAWGADGRAVPAPDTDAEAFSAAPLDEVALDLAEVIASVRPDAVVSYDADGGYGHPDHVMAHRAALRAAELTAVPFFVIAPDPTPGSHAVDISPVIGRKLQALQAHRTQVTVSGDHFALSSGPSRAVPDQEAYRRFGAPTQAEHPFREQPLAGRVLAVALSLLLGAGTATVGTVAHQADTVVAGSTIPLGVVIALTVATALMVGLRLVFGSRTPVTAAAVGLVAVLLLLAQASPGGSVLIPANTAGYAWTYGAPLIAALVLAWPTLPSAAKD
jgi:N-acetyl-1-D-myo-inositol-2-amino-2-deoxy-alpha-D-glucopyranoside deacetylase